MKKVILALIVLTSFSALAGVSESLLKRTVITYKIDSSKYTASSSKQIGEKNALCLKDVNQQLEALKASYHVVGKMVSSKTPCVWNASFGGEWIVEEKGRAVFEEIIE